MTELKLTPEEVRQVAVDDRRFKLQTKFDLESGQGVLPFTNERFFEQSNPIVRSALFSAGKIPKGLFFQEWTEIFSLGSGSIWYRGPALSTDHELVLARIMVLARGRSLTQSVKVKQADVCRWLKLDDSGANFKKARRILDDLAGGELRISSKPALKRLYNLLTRPPLGLPDRDFFLEYIKNRYGDQIKEIAAAIESDDTVVDISMRFLTNQAKNHKTGRLLLNLDPIAAIFFDGVNTTLVPFEIMDQLDRFGTKLLPFIASHRDGVWPIGLEKYHEFSGSKSEYQKVKRRVKSDLKKRFEDWQAKAWIEPGWDISRNDDGDEIVRGLKIGAKVRIRSELEILTAVADDLEDAEDSDAAEAESA
ncbi:TrfA [Pseudomonas aeruginosa]|uniref:TrfA n=1 Tax=Pseudomonas aeruginosa TaxID=287 RepID=A0A7S6K646_PSEAI|nr:TrfA [Pseudomonas aeruginosa]MBX5679852.1 TrfA [Pseudomonas aeruginosa]MBX5754331.1 TrfA [Pseudomonas aeruginosa]MBX6074846.1 TrfA [Pseudomonas aeruginosa]MBX6118158.1 TrfA [Pseudomonas aeruginosa]MBX6250439.1 TrfA [Pseudomonas aeruginosa]